MMMRTIAGLVGVIVIVVAIAMVMARIGTRSRVKRQDPDVMIMMMIATEVSAKCARRKRDTMSVAAGLAVLKAMTQGVIIVEIGSIGNVVGNEVFLEVLVGLDLLVQGSRVIIVQVVNPREEASMMMSGIGEIEVAAGVGVEVETGLSATGIIVERDDTDTMQGRMTNGTMTNVTIGRVRKTNPRATVSSVPLHRNHLLKILDRINPCWQRNDRRSKKPGVRISVEVIQPDMNSIENHQ